MNCMFVSKHVNGFFKMLLTASEWHPKHYELVQPFPIISSVVTRQCTVWLKTLAELTVNTFLPFTSLDN